MPRICFDVTLKGFTEINNRDDFRGEDAEKASSLLGDLVKWVVAPSKEALDRFLASYGLLELLDGEPWPMSQHACENYGRADGVDFIVDNDGNVLEGNIDNLVEDDSLASWRELAADAAALLAK